MKLALITDAWEPHANEVVITLVELARELALLGHQVEVIHPGLFKTRPCPGFPELDLALRPGKTLLRHLEAQMPDAIHIATEGVLGWAARSYCLQHGLAFTSGFHTRVPEMLNTRFKVPQWLGYAILKYFHKPSSGIIVPTQGVLRGLSARRFDNLRCWTHGVDMQVFPYREVPQVYAPLGTLARPVSLYVGKVSSEKNIDAFLQLNVPGTKVVCGEGPQESALRERYPHVRWLGSLPRAELAKVYSAADVLVMPSYNETFGLAMLEAMASGTPVLGYPVAGALEVVGSRARGGVLDANLSVGWYRALAIPRHEARARAMDFSWPYAALLFAGHLVSARQDARLQTVYM